MNAETPMTDLRAELNAARSASSSATRMKSRLLANISLPSLAVGGIGLLALAGSVLWNFGLPSLGGNMPSPASMPPAHVLPLPSPPAASLPPSGITPMTKAPSAPISSAAATSALPPTPAVPAASPVKTAAPSAVQDANTAHDVITAAPTITVSSDPTHTADATLFADAAARPVPALQPRTAELGTVVVPDGVHRLRLTQTKPGEVIRSIQYFQGWTLVQDKRPSSNDVVATLTQDVANLAGEVVLSFSYTTDVKGNPFAILRTPRIADGKDITVDFGPGGGGQATPAVSNTKESITYLALTALQLDYLKAGGLVQISIPAAATGGASVSVSVHSDGLKAALAALPSVMDTRKPEKS